MATADKWQAFILLDPVAAAASPAPLMSVASTAYSLSNISANWISVEGPLHARF